LNTPLVDLYEISRRIFSELGPNGVQFMHFPDGSPDDDMHLSSLGAIYISRVLTHYFPDELGPYLTGIFDPPPTP
jgi:hypothetical protein